MTYFQRFTRGVRKFLEEVLKPESFTKGEDFEEYVRQYMFPRKNYDILHKSPKFSETSKDFIESSMLPDLKLRDKKSGREFYVECKFRAGYLNWEDKIEWCNENQLHRYQTIHRNELPVFVTLGFGDNGSRPKEVCLFSMEKANWTGLYESFLDRHSFYLGKPVYPSYLWKLA